MLKNYFKIAWRNLLRNKGYSFINISGLAMGMAVAIIIGIWIQDELSFDTYPENHSRIAQVWQTESINSVRRTDGSIPIPTGDALRTKFGSEFKYVVMSSGQSGGALVAGDKTISKQGAYMEPDAPAMLGIKMVYGTRDVLKDPASVLISKSTSEAFFGKSNPVGKAITIKKVPAKVAGVYEDIPTMTSFGPLEFIAPWGMFITTNQWAASNVNNWSNTSFKAYVQLAENADIDKVSSKIKNIRYDAASAENKKRKPELFLFPMSKWHLYGKFKDGVNVGGGIQFVWLFGIIGAFVLLLACINFMNLSTARSEKRAREVGIRKTVGSLRGQIIAQFFSESLIVVLLSFVFAILLVKLSISSFNEVSGKHLDIAWSSGIFWLSSMLFILITAILAGSYPALYLSSFEPVKVLKGTFKAGRLASLPRKVLVVVQFSVSIILVIGTIIVFRQINFAKDRPVGYEQTGLLMINQSENDIFNHFDALRAELVNEGIAEEIALSFGPATGVYDRSGGFDWRGRDQSEPAEFNTNRVSRSYGKTVGWQFVSGRDFSAKMPSDSSGIIINQAAADFIGFKNPVGGTIEWGDDKLTILGVIKNMIMESPYAEPKPMICLFMGNNNSNFVNIRLKEGSAVSESIDKIQAIFKKYSPESLFSYNFADEAYEKKFEAEQRIGTLASSFAGLAIFISCLGLFGMASFSAEQRTKEIGIRKILGASVANLWRTLSKEFVVLVLISCLIAAPIATYFLHRWLQNYEYRTEISWWMFAVSAGGALIITLITVSFQAIKAAIANPIKSLRME